MRVVLPQYWDLGKVWVHLKLQIINKVLQLRDRAEK
jgi:hypothetical protein